MRRAKDRARSATIESRALGALKLAREAGRFLRFNQSNEVVRKI